MWILYLLMLPIAVGISFYFRAFFKRTVETFGGDTSKKGVKAIIWALAVCVGALCLDVFHFGAIMVLHVFSFAVLLQLINFIIKNAAGAKYKSGFGVWKKAYGSGVIPLLLSAALLIVGYLNMHNIVRTDYTVYTEKDVGEGYRVVLVADVHYGVTVDDAELKEKCDEISALDSDMVILCGDIVDSSTTYEGMQAVFEAFGKVHSKHGVFYVYGNHDRSYSHGAAFTNAELEKAITESGVRILQDDAVDIDENLTVVGREDRGYTIDEASRQSMETLLKDIDKDRFILTLDHQPTEYKENGEAGTDLLLSGHTHGGQIWPMNIIFRLFNINDAVYGYTQIDKDTAAIVTSGFAGWSYPIKTSSPAEYVVIDIKQK